MLKPNLYNLVFLLFDMSMRRVLDEVLGKISLSGDEEKRFRVIADGFVKRPRSNP